MASRSDQLHSYQFMVQRVVAAVVLRETDPARSPLRRLAGATLLGVLAAVLALAGTAGYGLLRPVGGDRDHWRDPGVVIEESGSGALFVYREADRALHPVLNYASALLIVGRHVRTVRVTHGSLDRAPRGATLGIQGAPDSLPPRQRLRRDPWTICSTRSGDGVPRSVLFVAGGPRAGGRSLAETDGAKALLVTTPDGARYVIYRHHRHLVRDPDVLLPPLVWNKQPVAVAAAFVNALPAGADMARLVPAVVNFGAPTGQPPGGRVGQVYAVDRPAADGQDYFVATGTGLARITPLQKEWLLGDPLYQSTIKRQSPSALTRQELTRYGQSLPEFQPGEGTGALPETAPGLENAGPGGLCVSVNDRGGASAVRVDVPVDVPAELDATGSRDERGAVLADAVVVPPGCGVLVSAAGPAGDDGGTTSLITDTRIRYSLSARAVVGMLGYAGAAVVELPVSLVSLVPAGRALDPEAARSPVPIA